MKNNKEEIKEIFKELKNGNKENFEKLYNIYKNLVYGIAFSIIKNKEDAEDIVQNVFLKIYNAKTESFPNNSELSWLYSVTKNEALQVYKKNNKTENIENIYEIPENNNVIEEIINRIEYNKLISKLPEKQKEVVSLKIIADFTFKEISKLLNESESTIKWRYYKATHSLKLIIGNLALFICTFIIGTQAYLKKDAITNNVEENNVNQSESPEKQEEQNNYADIKEEEIKGINSEMQNVLLNDIDDKIEKSETANNSVTQENTIIDTNNNETNNTNYRLETIVISCIFLTLTIIFILFSTKNQLKAKTKKSK